MLYEQAAAVFFQHLLGERHTQRQNAASSVTVRIEIGADGSNRRELASIRNADARVPFQIQRYFAALSRLRQNGELTLEDVGLALLETNGAISVLRRDGGRAPAGAAQPRP